MKKKLKIYTDGSYRAKTNTGAWGAVLQFPDGVETQASGVVKDTTNNVMELMGVMAAYYMIIVEDLDKEYDIEIVCDSKYVVEGLTKWYPGWKLNGWRTASFGAVKNLEKWKELVQLYESYPQVKLSWTKGHENCDGNNKVDALVAGLTANP